MQSYDENKKLKVVNFFGRPGSGKSTVASAVFANMKKRGYNVEFVSEYAKDLVWSDRQNMFSEQDYILAKHNNKLRSLVGKVDYAISDTSLLLGLFYLPSDFPESFKPFLFDVYNSYTNINFFLEANYPYIQLGRNQTEEQAQELSSKILSYLQIMPLPFYRLTVPSFSDMDIIPSIIYDSFINDIISSITINQ